MATHEIEIFVVMGEDGAYEVGVTDDDATERFDENIGGHPRRIVRIVAHMNAPTMEEAEVVIGDEAGEVAAKAEDEDEEEAAA